MVNIIKQEVVIEESLKKKLELICEFSNTTLKIINGSIRKIDRTNLTYVEPIVSKELWDSCQVQKKKNQKKYMRTQTYIFLQKLRCPKCGRILVGGTSHKIKADKWY